MSQAPSIKNTQIDLAAWQPATPPDERDADGIVDWAAERFTNHAIAMTTSFGMEGVVLLDLLAARISGLRIIYVDTGFLFPETLRLRDQLIERYPDVGFEAVHPQLSADEQQTQFGAELWKAQPDLCCRMRKMEPLHRSIMGVDVWFTAIRRGQSPTRWNTQIVDWDWTYQLLKICPLATWTRRRVYDYLKEHALPYNELHDQSYPTVGCTHCTRPVPGVKPWEYSREGRWTGKDKTECGLHGDGI